MLTPARSDVAARLAVYLVADPTATRGRALDAVVADAVRGGATLVQLRVKDPATRPFVESARALASLLRPLGVPLVINDRVDVALAVGAGGVQLGRRQRGCGDHCGAARGASLGCSGRSEEHTSELQSR